MSLKISKIFAIPLIFSSFLFHTNNEFNKVHANIKNLPANKNDLDFTKTLSVASATFTSVVSQKHEGKIIEGKRAQTVDMNQK